MEPIEPADHPSVARDPGVDCLYFFAPWCEPCKLTGPVFERVAGELAGTATFMKVGADQAGGLMQSRGIRGVPTILVLKAGQEVIRKTGPFSAAQLRALVGTAAQH